MGNKDYIISSLDEYFEILDRENKKRSGLVAKSLVKYLQKSKKSITIELQDNSRSIKYFGKR